MSLAAQYDTLRTPGESKLRDLHRALVCSPAYGFTDDEDLLAQLLALNVDVADAGSASCPGRPPTADVV